MVDLKYSNFCTGSRNCIVAESSSMTRNILYTKLDPFASLLPKVSEALHRYPVGWPGLSSTPLSLESRDTENY